MSLPRSVTEPLRTGMRPNRDLSSVDLPAPLGPMMPIELPVLEPEVAAGEDVDPGHVAGDDGVGGQQAHRRPSSPLVAAVELGPDDVAVGAGGGLHDLLLLPVAEVAVVVAAEVGVDHLLVGPDGLRRALGDDPPLGHHDDPVGDVEDHVHVVLDEDHAHALGAEVLDVAEQRLGERRVHAGHGLVEHDQLGFGHEGTGHLEQLALAAGERSGELPAHVAHVEAHEQLVGAGLDLLLLLAPHRGHQGGEEALAPLAGGAELHVLDHRHLRQRLGELERADHAAPGDLVGGHVGEVVAVEAPGPGVRLVEPGEQVEERRLAGAVRADERGDGAALELHVVDVHRREATEAPGDAVGDQDRIGLGDAGDLVDAGERGAGRRGLEISGHRARSPCGRRRCPGGGR